MAEPMVAQAVIDTYVDAGWWGTHALADLVVGHAPARPDDPAYIVAADSGDGVATWGQYHERSSELAAVFVQAGLDPGTRIGVILPDGASVHTVFLAAEKAGLVVAGIGARAGPAEIRHLLGRMRATALVTHAHHRGQPSSELAASLRAGALKGLRHIVVPDVAFAPGSPTVIDGNPMAAPDRAARERLLEGRAPGAGTVFMAYSTSRPAGGG